MKKAILTLMCLTTMMVTSMYLKAQEVTITIMPGWNWISCPLMDTVDFGTAMGSFTPAVGDIIKSQWSSATYLGNGQWRGNMTQFYPGYGYMYKSNRTMPDTVTFNAQQPQEPPMVEPDSILFTIPAEQWIGQVEEYAIDSVTGGLHLNFEMPGITHVVMESVDGYSIAGNATVVGEIVEGQSIITFSAPSGSTFEPETDYYIVTFPCDVYGGYRLSIYKDGLVAHYFGVHQTIVAGGYITPPDLDESELEFVDPDAPLVEEEPPGLNHATRIALARYLHNPTEANRLALMEQMGIRYDKVVARKKAKLRELEREAHHQHLIDEMQAIVDEMVENREMRLEQQFRRLTDRREDDDPTDEWLVLRGVPIDNAYIGYAPVTNEEYAAFDPNFTYETGHERYPVVNVTYFEAVAYCEWLGSNDALHAYRVTTEDDWVMAAGHMPKDIAMNSGQINSGLTPVDAYAQTTGACGGIDFWGNCWEWTSTQNDSGGYIVKGGAWDSTRDSCRTEYSGDVRDGSYGYPNVGFRVVRVDSF